MSRLDELFAQHPLPWRFDEQPDADGIVAVRDASGADVMLLTDEIAYVQMGRVVAALPELLNACLDAAANDRVVAMLDRYAPGILTGIRVALTKAGAMREGR